MNINNIEAGTAEIPAKIALLPTIFKAQEQLLLKYKEIEGIPDWPMPFQSKDSQIWFKDFLWRTTEELSEAIEAIRDVDSLYTLDSIYAHVSHFYEEIADAIHFFVDLMILTEVNYINEDYRDCLVSAEDNANGIPPGVIGLCYFKNGPWQTDKGDLNLTQDEGISLEEEIGDLVFQCANLQYTLGLIGNVLKNKRWKQTEVMSDYGKFSELARFFLESLFDMLMSTGLNAEDVYLLYNAKRKVNQWRQNSNY